MSPSYFEYIFGSLKTKSTPQARIKPEIFVNLGPNPARTRARPEKPGPTYNSDAGLGFFEPYFCLPSISLIIHSKNQSQLIEIFDRFLFVGKIQLIAFDQQTSLSNCCF